MTEYLNPAFPFPPTLSLLLCTLNWINEFTESLFKLFSKIALSSNDK